MTTSVTFRCPDDLLFQIDSFGQENFPVKNASGCDRSKTLIFLLAAGLNSLDNTPSKTDEIQVLKQVLQEAINQEVKETVQQELAEVRQALDERIDFLEERVRNDGGLVPLKLEVLAKHLERIERAML